MVPFSSKDLKAAMTTSSSSVPPESAMRVPKRPNSWVKLIGPDASLIISSNSFSLLSLPTASKVARRSLLLMMPSLSWSISWKASLNSATWFWENMEKTLEPVRLAFFDELLEEVLVSAAGAGASAGASAAGSSFFFFLTFFSLSACEEIIDFIMY